MEWRWDDDDFFDKAYGWAAERRDKGDEEPWIAVVDEEYLTLSRQVDDLSIQESCAVRNVLRTRELAVLLVDDNGDILIDRLPPLIAKVKKTLYSLGPGREYDTDRQKHILRVLTALTEKKNLDLIKRISKPYSHKIAEEIIRDTLLMPAAASVTDADTRRAVLAAWLCYLRQNVGSCFATAPAIVAHEEQPHLFLGDLYDLLSTGRLKRTFGGIEYSAPLSPSWGAGDLKKPLLLRRDTKLAGRLLNDPGINRAFKAMGIAENGNELFGGYLLKVMENAIDALPSREGYILTDVEAILQLSLLRHLNITAEDVEEYSNRPKPMIHSGLMMHTPMPGRHSSSKGDASADFPLLIEEGKNAFKALADNALLKAWEFTVASFAETLPSFSRWNFYASLGLNTNENGGIGEKMYEVCKQKLDYYNVVAQEHNENYERVYDQVKYLETRVRTASTEQEAKWLKVELQSLVNEFQSLETMRDRARNKAQGFANLYNVLHEVYEDLFPEYFQEVYDADMHDVGSNPYDDSPAGFRLVYKHGRANSSLWTRITTPTEFVDSLVSFFVATEREVYDSPYLKGMGDDLSEIVTVIVKHVRTDEFLESALHRMARVHNAPLIKEPLKHLDKIDKKPWVYTSGGNMNNLVSCYFGRQEPPSTVSRWVENPMELLVFLIDAVRTMPESSLALIQKIPDKRILMHSPTHAFNFMPDRYPFKRGWETDAYTYTWTRDNLVMPMEKFVNGILLDEERVERLLQHLCQETNASEKDGKELRSAFGGTYSLIHLYEFRERILDAISRVGRMQSFSPFRMRGSDVDAFLYRHVPLVDRGQLKARFPRLLEALAPTAGKEAAVKALALFNEEFDSKSFRPIYSAEDIRNMAKALLCIALKGSTLPSDLHYAVAEQARAFDMAMPMPLIFADSNWVKDYFAFAVNPGTTKLELWRTDATGLIGHPMADWSHWLDGSRRDRSWGIFHRPQEYIWRE